MIILDTTTKSLELKLAGAITTTQLPWIVSYVDSTAAAPLLENDGTTNNGTAVTMVAAPGASSARIVKEFNVFNSDTVVAIVTIQLNNNGTLRIIDVVTLNPGDCLKYADGGFTVITGVGVVPISVPFGGTGAISLTGIIKGNGAAAMTAIALPADATKFLDGTGAFSSPSGTTQTTILTGNQNNFALNSGVTILYCNNATALVLTGLAAGIDGQSVDIVSIGAGTVAITEQDTNSIAANRIITNLATQIGAAGQAIITIEYNSSVSRWRLKNTFAVYEIKCTAWNNAVETIPNTTITSYTLNSNDNDVYGMHSTSVNPERIIVPCSGTYMAVVNTTWVTNGTGIRRTYIFKNNATVMTETDQAPGSASRQTTYQTISPDVAMAAGDYFNVKVFQESGGNLDCGDNALGTATKITIRRTGP